MSIRKILSLSIKSVIFLQAGICLLMMALFLSNRHKEQVVNYGHDAASVIEFSLGPLNESQQQETVAVLAQSPGFLIKHRDFINQGVNFSELQVAGNVEQAPELSLLGNPWLTKKDLDALLKANNENVTLGTYISQKDAIKPLAQPLLGSPIYVSKLMPKLAEQYQGTYRLIGLDQTSEKKFFKQLTKATGKTEVELRQALSGGATGEGILDFTLGIGLIGCVFLLGILLVSYTVASLKELGTLSLLGWSKRQMAQKLYLPFISTGCLGFIAVLIGAIILYHGNMKIIGPALVAGGGSLGLLVLVVAIVSLMIYFMSGIKAIKGILPKYLLYGLAVSLYLLLSVGLIGLVVALDGPMQQLHQNHKLVRSWNEVGQYQTLQTFEEGNNPGALRGMSDSMEKEFHAWYSDVERQKGTYYIDSAYYDERVRDNVMNEYSDSPILDQNFTLMGLSPTYLKEHQLPVTSSQINAAYAGKRVVLLPKHWSKIRQEQAKKWMTADLKSGISDTPLQTKFMQHPEIVYATYDAGDGIFTWATQAGEPAFDRDTIINVVTSANMLPIEFGSLHANMLDGRLKFKDKATMQQQTRDLAKYNLADNKLEYVPVLDYIDGLQKTIMLTIAIYGSVLLFVLLMLFLVILTLTLIFSIVNERQIFVKELLGFPLLKIYRVILGTIIVVGILQCVVVVGMRSQFGMYLVPISLLMQVGLLYWFVRQHSVKKIKGH